MNVLLDVIVDLKCKAPDVVLIHYCRISVNNLDGSQQKLTIHKKTKIVPLEHDLILSQTECFNASDFLCLFYSNVNVQFNNYVLTSGSIAIFDCRQPMSYIMEQFGYVYFVFIPPQFCGELIVPSVEFEGRGINSAFISYILERIDKESTIMLSSKVLPFMYLLVTSVAEAISRGDGFSLSDKIKDAIYTNALNPLFSLGDIASLFSCSKRTLHNCLSVQGSSYSKLIQDYRVNHFAELLVMDRNANIEALCYRSGFNSPSYAIKKFKAAKGLTPKQYRICFS